ADEVADLIGGELRKIKLEQRTGHRAVPGLGRGPDDPALDIVQHEKGFDIFAHFGTPDSCLFFNFIAKPAPADMIQFIFDGLSRRFFSPRRTGTVTGLTAMPRHGIEKNAGRRWVRKRAFFAWQAFPAIIDL